MKKAILATIVVTTANGWLVDSTENYVLDRSTAPLLSSFTNSEIPSIQIQKIDNRKMSQKSSIEGNWNLDRARQIILPRLQNHKWEKGDTDHQILSQYKLPYKKKDARLIVTASIREGSDCFACSKDLSFFVFEKQNTAWKLASSHLEITSWGHYGIADAEGISVKIIGNNGGDNICGIMLQSFVAHGGGSGTSTTIYTIESGTLRSVFPTIDTSAGNLAGAPAKGREVNWDSKITIQPETGSNGFFNILVKSEGIRNGKPFSENKLFKFNGQKYVPQKR
jgi:hypothetical protein